MSENHKGDGVLSNLPSTRPQRRSSKRDAPAKRGAPAAEPDARKAPPARDAGAEGAPPRRAEAPPRGAPRGAAAGSEPAAAKRSRTPGPIAAQGFESRLPGQVTPPSNTDILVSAVRAAGELAQAGLTLGEHVARAAARRLKP